MQFQEYKIRYHRINHIFISHLHGDHYLGLMGLLFTMHLNGRTTELHIYSQQELMDIIDLQLRMSNTRLKYNLIFHPLQYYGSQVIYEDEEVQVTSFILQHRIPTVGFVFSEKQRPPKINALKTKEYNIPVSFYSRIKAGEDFIDGEGNIIKMEELTEPSDKPRSYAYCSDTRYFERIVNEIRNVDLLYHEATFLSDMENRAYETFHSTPKQAATIALKANVGKLLIGHFSSRYKDLDQHLAEARSVFTESYLAIEGQKYQIKRNA